MVFSRPVCALERVAAAIEADKRGRVAMDEMVRQQIDLLRRLCELNRLRWEREQAHIAQCEQRYRARLREQQENVLLGRKPS